MSIEQVTEDGSSELIGELRIGPSNSLRCISDLPFFKVPDRHPFRLRFRLFHLEVEVAEQHIEFDATPSGDELQVHGGLLWLRNGIYPPRLLSSQEIADLPDRVYRQARLLLQCRITKEGRVAPATHFREFLRSDATVHDVAIDLQTIEEQDPVRGMRSREQVEIVIELAKPLDLPVYDAFTVGFFNNYFSGGAFHLEPLTPLPSISDDGHVVHLRLGPLVHLSHVFITGRAGERLRCGGIEGRVLAFMYFGQRCDYDASMSQNIDRYLVQHEYYQRREPLREQNGVKLGPAGQAAIVDFFNALQPALANGGQEASDEALFARLLQDSGIDPLNVADVVRHANAIQALQWPKVFASWQAHHLKDRNEAELPVSPLEIVETVLQSQNRRGEAQLFKDALAAWQWFRKGAEPATQGRRSTAQFENGESQLRSRLASGS